MEDSSAASWKYPGVTPHIRAISAERRLHVAAFVRAARLKHRLAAVPRPGQDEPAVRLSQHRLLQLRVLPAAAAVGRNLHLANRPAARPGQARDLIETGAREHRASGRTRDHRFWTELEIEPDRLARERGAKDGVTRAFRSGLVGLVHDFDSPQPLHVAQPFESRHDEAQRVAVFRADGFAVLAVGHDHVLQRLFDRNALGQLGRFVPFGDDPCGRRLQARALQQRDERDARPDAAARPAVRVLHGLRQSLDVCSATCSRRIR